MQSIIIKKWIEPYVLLETYKKYYGMEDITFDSISKEMSKNKMIKNIQKSEGKSFGLYMKNVNKYYVFSSSENILKDDLIKYIDVSDEVCEISSDTDTALASVDLAKAEAVLVLY